MFLRHLFKIVHDHLVHVICRVPDHRRNVVHLVPLRDRAPRVRAATARQRAPRHDGHLAVGAERQDFPFFLTVNQIVLRLEGNELRPAVFLGDVLHPLQLPRENRGRADVPRLTAFHHVVQRLHRFLHRRIRVEAVNLIEVHIVKAKPLQAVVDFRHHVLARRAAAVRTTGAHLEIHLRRHHDLVAVQSEVLDIPSRDFLAGTHLIHVRRVEIVDAKVNSLLEHLLAVLVVLRPREHAVLFAGFPEAHHAETNPRNVHPRAAEFHILHKSSLPSLLSSLFSSCKLIITVYN